MRKNRHNHSRFTLLTSNAIYSSRQHFADGKAHDTDDVLRDVADRLCNVFLDQNPSFNRSRFLKACGLIE